MRFRFEHFRYPCSSVRCYSTVPLPLLISLKVYNNTGAQVYNKLSCLLMSHNNNSRVILIIIATIQMEMLLQRQLRQLASIDALLARQHKLVGRLVSLGVCVNINHNNNGNTGKSVRTSAAGPGQAAGLHLSAAAKKENESRAMEIEMVPTEYLENPVALMEYLMTLCGKIGLTNTSFAHVRSDYYALSLEERRDILNADSVSWLCKSVIMENVRLEENVEDKNQGDTPLKSTSNVNPWDAATNPRYIMVIIQYIAKSNKEKLIRAVFSALNGRVNKRKMNWRLADESIAQKLSGYGHNAMTPLGMQSPIPILMSDRVMSLPYIWLGGGHVDVKWRVNPQEFANYFHAHVADISSD